MWIVLVVLVALIWLGSAVLVKRYKGHSSAAIFLAEANTAIENNKTPAVAILTGLKALKKMSFFNQLSEDDILRITFLFNRQEDIYTVSRLIIKSKKENNIEILKDSNFLSNARAEEHKV